jgi:hypothetical protein
MSWLAVIAAVVIGVAPTPPLTAPAPPAPVVQPTPTPAPAPAPPSTPVVPDGEDGPPASNAQAGVGESQIRTSYQTAEATRGALDGRWRLSLDGGQELYIFQFSDSGGAPDARATTPMSPQVEGAWRDMRHPDGLNASGMFETVRHNGADLTIVFDEGEPPRPQTLTLQPLGSAWTGALTIAGVRTKVTMTRE